ncbi:50S ribosomal protein L17 [Tunicatimonas pelagia]|uniref:50S ribosomal protein L17 n=1 Tax=Tunicatimonas pelagia TaxID=931531 RepID=UPI0026670633|nr:50S ribosomal protein L17 [Tunicatimonas pelagia]WKN42280.1 50S ribosomal protein L17 [Tunicatimonas pelagia]
MRHGKRFNHLGRTSSHRKSTLANMASSLIIHKRLTTTVAKAKALRQYVEPLITRSKVDSTHSRRVVFSYLKDKDSSRVLFDEVAEKVAERPGGYTRIIKLGNRLGDNAEMCMIELVDFNEIYNQEEKQAKTKTRRSRRGGKKKIDTSTQAAATSEAVTETEEPQTAEESAVEEETVELSGEVVVEDTTTEAETETAQEVEASTATEEQVESDDQPQAEDAPSEEDDEKESKG